MTLPGAFGAIPEDLQIDVVARNLRRAMTVTPGQDQKFPSALDTVVVPTIPFPGTEMYEEILLESVVGAADDVDIECAEVPAGEIWVPIAIEGTHLDSGVTRYLSLQFRWRRAGATTSVVLGGSKSVADLLSVTAPLERLYFPQFSRLALTISGLTAGKNMTLRMAYMKRTLGEVAPL